LKEEEKIASNVELKQQTNNKCKIVNNDTTIKLKTQIVDNGGLDKKTAYLSLC